MLDWKLMYLHRACGSCPQVFPPTPKLIILELCTVYNLLCHLLIWLNNCVWGACGGTERIQGCCEYSEPVFLFLEASLNQLRRGMQTKGKAGLGNLKLKPCSRKGSVESGLTYFSNFGQGQWSVRRIAAVSPHSSQPHSRCCKYCGSAETGFSQVCLCKNWVNTYLMKWKENITGGGQPVFSPFFFSCLNNKFGSAFCKNILTVVQILL